ncbi:GNAT family N-acetyltransferase [Hirschia maritima]|uniref:GNAT family N-acetyltransferase n=1 Tax=Hirschia maritima TaxID=1121961 RepID=UPI00037214AC|nr:GNAT family N-acetyltransferase [Hirschia maritima]
MSNLAYKYETIFRLRPARSDEVETLQLIDIKSCEIFRDTGLIDLGPTSAQLQPIPEEKLRQGLGDGLLWISADERDNPIGFALCSHKQECLYLDQVSVLPEHGQRGLGRQLVFEAISAARDHDYKHITLSTFRDVPWNGKFYRSMGFKEIPRRRLAAWQLELEQLQKSTMDVSKRCFMQKSVKRLFF